MHMLMIREWYCGSASQQILFRSRESTALSFGLRPRGGPSFGCDQTRSPEPRWPRTRGVEAEVQISLDVLGMRVLAFPPAGAHWLDSTVALNLAAPGSPGTSVSVVSRPHRDPHRQGTRQVRPQAGGKATVRRRRRFNDARVFGQGPHKTRRRIVSVPGVAACATIRRSILYPECFAALRFWRRIDAYGSGGLLRP